MLFVCHFYGAEYVGAGPRQLPLPPPKTSLMSPTQLKAIPDPGPDTFANGITSNGHVSNGHASNGHHTDRMAVAGDVKEAGNEGTPDGSDGGDGGLGRWLDELSATVPEFPGLEDKASALLVCLGWLPVPFRRKQAYPLLLIVLEVVQTCYLRGFLFREE